MKKIVSTVVAATLLAQMSFSAFAASPTYNTTTYFDEWDWQNQSSRYTRLGDRLDRGLVAVKTDSGVFLSWRLNGYESENAQFNIYRDNVLITAEPVYLTNYTDTEGTLDSTYTVGLVVDGTETKICDSVTVLENQYKEIKVAAPPVITTETNTEYTLNDVEVGDLNGDGKYDFVVKVAPFDATDAGLPGVSDHTYLDAYTSEGEHLWRIDIGPNIRAGAHELSPMLYDFNGDGAAELAVMTSDGTVALRPNADGNGTYGNFGGEGGSRDYNYDVISVIGDPREVGKAGGKGRWTEKATDGANTNIYGPIYLTVFDGLSGEEIDTVPYDPQTTQEGYEYATKGYVGEDTTITDASGTVWSFDGYNIAEGAPEYNTGAETEKVWDVYRGVSMAQRFGECVAYINGTTPSLVTQRGIYSGRVAVCAYNLVKDENGKEKIKQEWRADSYNIGSGATGGINAMGYHNLSVGDLDGSGKDSVITGASAVKYDGTLLWSTQRGHGDAQHLSKYDPTLPGLQWFGTHEKSSYGFSFIDASTGKDIVKRKSADEDTGRGVIGIWGNITENGFAHMSAAAGAGDWTYTNDGTTKELIETGTLTENVPSNISEMNARIYWDGDLWDEVMDGKMQETVQVDGVDTVQVYSDSEAYIHSYNEDTKTFEPIFITDGCATSNGTKKNPGTIMDIFGDWREEFIMRTADNTALRIYTTIDPTDYRFYTFMHDGLYRVSAARQNSGYNQPPHIGFYMADKDGYRDLQPKANVYLSDGGVKFNTQPQDNQNMIKGNISGTLKAEAISYPVSKDISYQWYMSSNGEEAAIDGAVSSELTIPTDLDAGEYSFYCKATDGEMVNTSFASDITVLDTRNLAFTVQPETGINAYEGKINKTLSVSAQAVPVADINYQWYVSSTPDGEGTAIDGANESILSLPADLTVGEYYYYCTISCADTEEIKSDVSHVTIHSTATVDDPITGSYNEENSRYEWKFNTVATTTARETRDYSDDFVRIRVGLGTGDAITLDDGTLKSGICFSNPSIREKTTSGYKTVNDTGRYIMVKPAVDGTINFTLNFTSASSKKANRIYYTSYDNTEFDAVDLSTLQKGSDNHIGNTTSTASQTALLELSAGKTYVFYMYQAPSYVTAMSYDCADPDATPMPTVEPTATPTSEPTLEPTSAPTDSPASNIVYDSENNTVISKLAGTVIIANYDENGTLLSVDMHVTDANVTITPKTEVKSGTKIYIWNDLENMKPLDKVYEY